MLAVGLFSFSAVLGAKTQPAATTLFVHGKVSADSKEHGLRDLNKSAPLYTQDRVNTHSDGRAQLRFTDGGLVSLMPDTLFSIEEYFFEDEQSGDLVFGLLKGGLRTVTGAIGKMNHKQYQLNTPVATLGIRGTEYTAVLAPPNTLRVHVGRGKIVLTNEQGELVVSEGQSAVAIQGQAPRLSEEGPLLVSPGLNLLETEEMQLNQDPLIADYLQDFPEIGFEQLTPLNNSVEPDLDPADPDPGWVDPELPIGPDEPGSIEFCENMNWDHEACIN